MKKRSIYFFIALLGLFFQSCDEWLYVEPTDGIIVDEYWQSKEDVEAAVFGCYASLLGNTGNAGTDIPTLLFLHGELRADMVTYYYYIENYRNIQNGDILITNSLCKWDAFYRTINNCNLILSFSEKVKENDKTFTEEARLQYESEARGIRALMYFYLTRLYDEVPLKLTGQVSDDVDYLLPKSSRTEIFQQIKADLSFAAQYIPTTYGSNDEDKGRLTRYSIKAIQADVYLWCEQYDSALIACDEIINSGKYGVIDGYDNPDQWFTDVYVNGNSNEGIFELQFHQDKLNPYFYIFSTNYKYVIANYNKVSDLFMNNPDLPQDSIDIRSNGTSYLASRQYELWKYMGKTRRVERTASESYAHFFVYRYAEILLFKAEAMIMSNNDSSSIQQAMEIINTLRKKRHASALSAYTGTYDSRDGLLLYILEERNRELLSEGKRWFDILRFGKRDHYKYKNIIIGALVSGADADRIQTLTAKANDTLFYYLPIHDDEIQRNPNLIQNEFYK